MVLRNGVAYNEMIDFLAGDKLWLSRTEWKRIEEVGVSKFGELTALLGTFVIPTNFVP